MDIRHRSGPAREDDINEESQLGLSLRLHTNQFRDPREDRNKEELTSSSLASAVQHKLQRTEFAGITTHVASQANRKARVSVRARCESATVS